MQKKKITILFIIIIIVFIILGGLLFLNIQLMKAPEVIIKIELSEINSEDAILHTTIDIDNPNGFEIIIKNLKLVTTTQDRYEVSCLSIEGGVIGSHKKEIFTEDVIVTFNGHSPELLTSKITGEVGANFLFIQKIIPLNIGVVTSVENLINELAAPSLNVKAKFEEITNEGINLTATIDVFNPNTFKIYVENVSTELETEIGKKVGNIDVIGGVIAAKDLIQLNCSGMILLETLNAEELLFNISGIIGGKIAGFKKNLPFNIKTTIIVPDLEELLLSKDKPTILSIKVDEKFTLKGVVFEVILQVNNTYKIDLVFRDIICRVYMVDDDKHKLLGENNIVKDIVAEVGKSGFSSCEILVPFSKILSQSLSADWIMVSVSSKITTKGVDQSVIFEIKGYHDLHLFK